MGKASNLNSLRENYKFSMSLQGLDCLQFNIIYMPKWQIWGRPILNPYRGKALAELECFGPDTSTGPMGASEAGLC